MPGCDKCWDDAFTRSMATHRSQAECYHELLEERKGNPCTPEQQTRNSEPDDVKALRREKLMTGNCEESDDA